MVFFIKSQNDFCKRLLFAVLISGFFLPGQRWVILNFGHRTARGHRKSRWVMASIHCGVKDDRSVLSRTAPSHKELRISRLAKSEEMDLWNKLDLDNLVTLYTLSRNFLPQCYSFPFRFLPSINDVHLQYSTLSTVQYMRYLGNNKYWIPHVFDKLYLHYNTVYRTVQCN